MKINSPLEAYKFLPATNCGECGEPTCMAFAAHLIDRSHKLTDCTPILEPKFKKKYEELDALLAPEIRKLRSVLVTRSQRSVETMYSTGTSLHSSTRHS